MKNNFSFFISAAAILLCHTSCTTNRAAVESAVANVAAAGAIGYLTAGTDGAAAGATAEAVSEIEKLRRTAAKNPGKTVNP